MLRIMEFIHDGDFSEKPTNLDLWADKREEVVSGKFHCYRETEYPDPGGYDLLILHGGDQHLWNKEKDPWLCGEIDYVAKVIDAGKPVLGFCLGSQIITEACGGVVFPGETEEMGFYRIIPREESRNHRIFRGLEGGFVTFEWHSDHYSLPDHMSTLAYTEGVPNQVAIGSQNPVVGFQFHPEFTFGNIGDYVPYAKDKLWRTGGEDSVPADDFLRYMDTLGETYTLFERLLANVLDHFAEAFPGSLPPDHISSKGL